MPIKPVIAKDDFPNSLYEEFASSKELAVDCEMMGLNHVRDRLCVVQVANEKKSCVVIQINENKEANLLRALLEDTKVIKIFHYARMDTLFLFARIGIDVQNIFCTKIASHLARTYTDRHGLKELVRELIGEHLDKKYQSSDWGTSELSDEQINYAIGDVLHLFDIKKCLESMLKRENRYELFQKLISFLPTQRELDILGYVNVLEHRLNL